MTCDCNKSKDTTIEAEHPDECPEGQHMVDGKCVPKEKPPAPAQENAFGDPVPAPPEAVSTEPASPGETQKAVGECPEGTSWNATSQTCEPIDTKHVDGVPPEVESAPKWFSAFQSQHQAELKKLETQIGLHKVKPLPTATVAAKNEPFSIQKITEKIVKWIENPKETDCVVNIPLDYMRNKVVTQVKTPYGLQEAYRSGSSLQEAVTISGTHATQDLDTDVAIVPGGISYMPIFQFAKVKQIAKGSDRARFFKTTIPATATQTVGTKATVATQTLTSVEVTPSTITGVHLEGDYDEIENSPFDLVDSIVQASAATYEDFVATDMLDTVSAEGTLTPGLWIRGDTGATITSSDVASMALDETGVAYGREYLEDQGYLRGGVKPVLFIDAQQWRELVTSSNVTTLAQNSVPEIWINAQLENFMGCQIVVSNAIQENTAQTNKGLNGVMCVPKHSYGIGVKRDVTIKLHDIPEENQVWITTSWRTKTGVIDATSIVRISTTGA